jgi:hypothetical protein
MPPTKRWTASYTDAKGKRHRRSFESKGHAELWEAEGRAHAAAEKAKKAASRVVAIQAGAESASR